MLLQTFFSLLLLLAARNSTGSANTILKVATPPIEYGEFPKTSPYGNYNETVLTLNSIDFSLLQRSIDIIEDDTCRDQCQLILTNLKNLTTWAAKFYYASAKYPENLSAGSLYELGNFDECLGIENDEKTPDGIRGQYCLTEVDVEVPEYLLNKRGSLWEIFKTPEERHIQNFKKLYWSICVPSACRAKNVEDGVRGIFSGVFNGTGIKVTPKLDDNSCYKNEAVSIDSLDIIYMCIILSVVFLIIIGTVFHAAHLKKQKGMPSGIVPEILNAFSLISNVQKLLQPAHDNKLHLDCIGGIKFISMGLIVAGHCMLLLLAGPVVNTVFYDNAVTKVENSVFLNNTLLVDTFFFVSAFLFCRILLQELDKRRSVNFLFLYIFRYLRLTPAYFAVIGFYVTWLPKLGSGPLWSRIMLERERCLSSWWTNLLYINNYVNTDKLCMFQAWYLAVDTQLFILAPIVIYPLWRWRKIGEYILLSVTALSVLIPFVITLSENLDPTLMLYLPELKDVTTFKYYKDTYIKSHMRAGAYCFGLVYGYIVYRIQKSEARLTKRTVVFGWLFSILSLTLSMCSIVVFYGPRKYFTALEAAVYTSVHRMFWCIGIGWIILTCITDHSGPIKTLLTWRCFVCLSRLTYSAYLINGVIELYSLSTVRSPVYLSSSILTNRILSHLLLTFIGAFFLSITLESPILGLERGFLRNSFDKKTSETRNREGNDTSSQHV